MGGTHFGPHHDWGKLWCDTRPNSPNALFFILDASIKALLFETLKLFEMG